MTISQKKLVSQSLNKLDFLLPQKLWMFYDLKNKQIFGITSRFRPFRLRFRFILIGVVIKDKEFLKNEAESTRTTYKYWQGVIH